MPRTLFDSSILASTQDLYPRDRCQGARDPKANEHRALQAGAEAFFQKPVDNDELMQAIQRALIK